MKHRRRKSEFDFDNDPSYQALVKNIKAAMNEAAAYGIDLRKRDACFECRACGAYEEGEPQAERTMRVYDKNKQFLSCQPFIIVGKKQRSCRRGRTHHYKTTYNYICSACGSYGAEIIREVFEAQ